MLRITLMLLAIHLLPIEFVSSCQAGFRLRPSRPATRQSQQESNFEALKKSLPPLGRVHVPARTFDMDAIARAYAASPEYYVVPLPTCPATSHVARSTSGRSR